MDQLDVGQLGLSLGNFGRDFALGSLGVGKGELVGAAFADSELLHL